MKNYTISKESVLALAATSQTARLILTENFPDAFKKELEVGKWYKGTADIEFLICYQGNNMENYGFWEDKEFRNNLSFGYYWVDECIEATPQEVETALIEEAKKRGFVEGTKFKDARYGKNIYKVSNESIFRLRYNEALCIEDYGNGTVFYEGKWAEIIQEETKVITMEKAVKILSKKYGKKLTIK